MIHFGFCDLAAIPVRTEPSDRAEISTQLLFGDLIEILDSTVSWLKIKNQYDNYVGWINNKQVKPLSEKEFRRLSNTQVSVNRQLFGDTVRSDGRNVHLPAGCSFYDLKDNVMLIEEKQYLLEGEAYSFHHDGMDELLTTAFNYLSCPYLWGGKTYLGLDCSGFTQVVYKQHGIKLLRDAVQQATQGELINILNDGKPGDLSFFDNTEGEITHVGILLDNQKILHCSGEVRIDDIDHQGIFNRDSNKYTHNLRLIRRM